MNIGVGNVYIAITLNNGNDHEMILKNLEKIPMIVCDLTTILDF